MLLTLAIGLQFSASAQLGAVCITNDRDCDIEVRLVGQCDGGGCDAVSVLVRIPANSFKCFTDYNDALANGIPPATAIPCMTFSWHGAEIQSVDCDCGGGGVSVGDGLCPHYITGTPYGPAVECCLCSPSGCPNNDCGSYTMVGGTLQVRAY